jgi:tetratricopeptide (TPR) repeat protein
MTSTTRAITRRSAAPHPSGAALRALSRILLCVAAASLTACGEIPPQPPSVPRPEAGPGSTATQPRPPDIQAPPPPEAPRPPKTFHLGAASLTLVSQAHKQSQDGDFGGAAASIERALRIEPNNPLLWIELGDIRMSEHNPDQADAMGRKALALATGDHQAESSAWHLIAESLRVRGRNQEAADADRKAAQLVPR